MNTTNDDNNKEPFGKQLSEEVFKTLIKMLIMVGKIKGMPVGREEAGILCKGT